MKKYVLAPLIVLILLLLTLTYLLVQFTARHQVPAGKVLVTIPAGQNASDIGRIIKENGIPLSPRMFSIAAQITGADKKLGSGVYEIGPDFTLFELLDTLKKGRGYSVQVFLPEGFALGDIADRLAEQLGLESAVFLELAVDSAFVDSLVPGAGSLEGFLYPDTYMVPVGSTERQVLKLLVDRFNGVFEEVTGKTADDPGFTRIETIILASIIEKEAKVPMERRLISGVFHNRLRLDRPIESCATIRFFLKKPSAPLSYADLSVESPYNTYLNPGLPPGPICNPGRASLEAAVRPADVDYLYFVARGDGSHIFSRTLAEHNRAKHIVKNDNIR